MITLYHTSPNTIMEIGNNGKFGEFLFFSDEEYVTTAGDHAVYAIEISQDDIIEATQLFYHEDAEKLNELVAELANEIGVDTEIAENLIDESLSIFDAETSIDASDLGDKSWEIQHYTARAAQILGFRGVEVTDEQGSAYMIAMQGAGRRCRWHRRPG